MRDAEVEGKKERGKGPRFIRLRHPSPRRGFRPRRKRKGKSWPQKGRREKGDSAHLLQLAIGQSGKVGGPRSFLVLEKKEWGTVQHIMPCQKERRKRRAALSIGKERGESLPMRGGDINSSKKKKGEKKIISAKVRPPAT